MIREKPLLAIGIDPGPVPGFAMIRWTGHAWVEPYVAQCSVGLAPAILGALLEVDPITETWVQIERFVVGNRSSRSSTPKAGAVTRDLVGELHAVWADAAELRRRSRPQDNGDVKYVWMQRPAASVKPWATDERLQACGLLAVGKGMRHSLDAARHAIFVACSDGDCPDPLSVKSRKN